MAESLTLTGQFKDSISDKLDAVGGKLKTLGFTADGVFKGLLRFATAKKVFQELGQAAGVVWKEALAESPKLQAQFLQIKEKIGVLVAAVAKELIPIFTNLFKFLLDNWSNIRFAFTVGLAAIQDGFYGLLGGLEVLASGFMNGLGLITTGLSKLGLVSKETADAFNKSSEELAEKAVTNFGKVGKTSEVLASGIKGLGKEVKATSDIFGDTKKLDDYNKKLEENNEAASKVAETMAKKNFKIMQDGKREEREMIAQEEQIKKGLLQKIDDEKLAHLEAQQGKELQALDFKYQRERKSFLEQKGITLLSEEEKQAGLDEITQRHAIQRTELENQLQDQVLQKEMEVWEKRAAATNQFASGFSSLFATQYQNRKSQIESELAGGKRLREEAVKAGKLSKEQADEQNKTEEEQAAKRLKAHRDEVKLAKTLSIVQVLINTAVGISKAFAQTGIFGYIAAAGIAAAGVAQIATINAQKFAEGGFPKGRNALVMVNDGPGGEQEAILNGTATRNLGRDRINALNAGQSFGGDTIQFSPNTTVTINGTANAEEVRRGVAMAYADQLSQFANMQKEVRNKKIKGR